ncbi:23S rRNA (guanosine(2251)-2'-O)-methyltransferase RlmB [Rubeoparvulum massiliense]|uniref:23S rRNA (guanosine(2251)-2'-O)-methyltransferase RlmB n=1 Tax=Rubeoparvulum massiliense TaxID=1631346 RepID=UPI00065E0B85|nr:23S rRNA (guanosine(2251)-2'-O)-methyltransferase RlmB [Rubeoparvulum massiliense]
MKNETIVGKNPVIEALRAGRPIDKIWLAEGLRSSQLGPILQLAKEQGVVVQYVPRKRLHEWAPDEVHQGVVATVAAYEYAELDVILANAKAKTGLPFLIMLDGLEDPHNLGSILRTADAVGADGIIIPKRRSVGLTSVVAKASAGAIEYVPVIRVANLVQTIKSMKDAGYWVVGTDAEGSSDYRTLKYDFPTLLIIGSEGKGISRLVREECDYLVHLPMEGRVTSLNASVAASLLMYEVYRQRNPLSLN